MTECKLIAIDGAEKIPDLVKQNLYEWCLREHPNEPQKCDR